MAKHIDFNYKDKDYRLEFNRITCMKADISFKELEGMEKKPELALKVIPALWSASFLMHHSDISEETKEEIYNDFASKDEELPEALVMIYIEPLETLFSKQGNVKWKKSW